MVMIALVSSCGHDSIGSKLWSLIAIGKWLDGH